MIKIENINRQMQKINTPICKGNVRTWSDEDLQKRIAMIITEAQVTGSVPSPTFFGRLANRARDIAQIVNSGSISNKSLNDIGSRINLVA